MVEIKQLDANQADSLLPELVKLLQDAVDSGGSLGFWQPLSEEKAQAYWQSVLNGLREKQRVLLVAVESGQILGSVQLSFAAWQNGQHRAEVQKLMVLQTARRQGLGQALLTTIEEVARKLGRSLLILDTKTGDTAEQLYMRHGYTRLGEIPGYVFESDGSFNATTYFYRLLKS